VCQLQSCQDMPHGQVLPTFVEESKCLECADPSTPTDTSPVRSHGPGGKMHQRKAELWQVAECRHIIPHAGSKWDDTPCKWRGNITEKLTGACFKPDPTDQGWGQWVGRQHTRSIFFLHSLAAQHNMAHQIILHDVTANTSSH